MICEQAVPYSFAADEHESQAEDDSQAWETLERDIHTRQPEPERFQIRSTDGSGPPAGGPPMGVGTFRSSLILAISTFFSSSRWIETIPGSRSSFATARLDSLASTKSLRAIASRTHSGESGMA